jgi:hypothetical protein
MKKIIKVSLIDLFFRFKHYSLFDYLPEKYHQAAANQFISMLIVIVEYLDYLKLFYYIFFLPFSLKLRQFTLSDGQKHLIILK